jgi:hypothetical protein
VGVAAVVALVAFLPFLRGVLAGHAFYFRDLSLQFWPLRRFIVEGLRAGTLRYWNPYTHEGEPLSLLPLGYPLDLLQLLRPTEAGFSLLLSLHVPLGAVAFFVLCRGLGVSRIAAAGGGLAYALGGFTLSTLNLYVYAQTVAWAPLLVLALSRAPEGPGRRVAVAGLLCALCLSTTGVEIVAQAALFGVLLAWPRSSRGVARLAGALLLGAGLAGVVLLPTAALIEGTAREAGFSTEIVLAHSVHPVTWLQTVVAGLYGDPSDLAERFWGENFFPRGFPYVLSLYLGLVVVVLALTAVRERPPLAVRLALVCLAAAVACLGRWAGLEAVVDALPVLHRFRYPTKAFFSVQFSTALLAALGLQSLLDGGRRVWKTLVALAAGLGATTAAAPWIALSWPAVERYLLLGFFPSYYSWARRLESARSIGMDATTSGLVALCVAALGGLVLAGRLRAPGAVLATVALLAADLLRAGAGLNPMVSSSFFSLSPPARELAAVLRREGGRAFVFDPSYSDAYYAARSLRAGRGESHESWSFRLLQETFVPDFNLGPRIATALSLDRTMLAARDRVLDPAQATTRSLPGLLPRLRAAGVRSLLALEPLEDPALDSWAVVAPPDLDPVSIHLHRLKDPIPLRAVVPPSAGRILDAKEETDRIGLRVSTREAATVLLRDAFARGWTATVDGQPARIERAEERYRAVAVPAGESLVEMRYVPPGLLPGIVLSAASALVAAWLFRRPGSGAPVG